MNRYQDRPMSEFVKVTTLADADLVPVVKDQTNNTITVANLKITLGLNGSTPRSLLSMTGNATNTVIATAGTAVLVAGTWTGVVANGFTLTPAGRATYTGTTTKTLNVDATVTMHPVSAGNVNLTLYVAKNGAIVASSAMTSTINHNEFQEVSVPWALSFATGDYVEIFVANEDSTVDILVKNAALRVS